MEESPTSATDRFLSAVDGVERPNVDEVLGHLRAIYAAARAAGTPVPIRVARPVFRLARQERPDAERIRLYTALDHLFPDDPQITGWVHNYLERFEEQAAWSEQLNAFDDPRDAQSLARLVETRDPDRAAEAYERAIALDDGPTSLTAAGAFFRRRKNYSRARELLERSLEVDPAPGSNAAGHVAMIALLRAQHELAEALKLGQVVLAARPADAFALNAVGAVCVDLGQYEEAEEHFIAAERVRPGARNTVENLRRLADTYRQRGDADGARRVDVLLARHA